MSSKPIVQQGNVNGNSPRIAGMRVGSPNLRRFDYWQVAEGMGDMIKLI
jgi:hypothetical protein